jgi:DNA modification methylase
MIQYPRNSVLVPAKDIFIDDNRRPVNSDTVQGIAESILREGLINPPSVIDLEGDVELRPFFNIPEEYSHILMAGNHRLTAMDELMNLELIPCSIWNTGPVTVVQKLQLELVENSEREPLSWQDKCLSVYFIWENSLKNKSDRTFSSRMIGRMIGVSKTTVNHMINIARAIKAGDERIINAENYTTALSYLFERAKTQLRVELNQRQAAERQAVFEVPDPDVHIAQRSEELGITPVEYVKDVVGKYVPDAERSNILAIKLPELPPEVAMSYAAPRVGHDFGCYDEDALITMVRFKNETFDGIFTDPMYGVPVTRVSSRAKAFRARFEKLQPKGAHLEEIDLLIECLPEFYRILKQNSWFVFFYDLDYHNILQDACRTAGFKVQNWPIIWTKLSACKNEAPRVNSTKNYESAMICRKGDATLVEHVNRSVIVGSTDDCPFCKTAKQSHPFVKPSQVWRALMKPRLQPGAMLYEPFGGVGSMPYVAYADGHNVIVSERDPDHFQELLSNVTTWRNQEFTSTKTNGETPID